MNSWKKNSNLVKHPRSTYIVNNQKRSDMGNRVEPSEKNLYMNISDKNQVRSDPENNEYWSETKNVPENLVVGNPIYHDNGTVNIGYDQYITSEKYSEEVKISPLNSKSFGNSVSFSGDGLTFASADVESGLIIIYTWNSQINNWVYSSTIDSLNIPNQLTKEGTSNTYSLTNASSSQFGFSISLSNNGKDLFVGAPSANFTISNGTGKDGRKGAVFHFSLQTDSSWKLNTRIFVPNHSYQTDYGYSVFLYDIDLFYAIGCPALETTDENEKKGSVDYFYKSKSSMNNGSKNYSASTAGGFCLDAYINEVTENSQKYVKQFILSIGMPYSDLASTQGQFNNIGKLNVITYNYSGNQGYLEDTNEVTSNDLQSNLNFGYSTSVSKQPLNNKIYIISGAPNFKENDLIIGKCYVYEVSVDSQGELNTNYKYSISNPLENVKGQFGTAVECSYDSINPSISIAISNPSNENTGTENAVYSFIQEENGDTYNKQTYLKWSGDSFMTEKYGFGYSIASTKANDLAIGYPSKQESNSVGEVLIYNNRIQLSLYVRGPTLLDGDGYGKVTMKNNIYNLQIGNTPGTNQNLFNLSTTNNNNINNFLIKSESDAKTIYSEVDLRSINSFNGFNNSLKIGAAGTSDKNTTFYEKGYLAFNNNLSFYNYNNSQGFSWMDGYPNPVAINQGITDDSFTQLTPVIEIDGKNVTINGNLNVTGNSTDVVTGQYITYDNSNNLQTTTTLNQYVNLSDQNADIFVANKCASSDLSTKVPLFSVNPYSVVTTSSVQDIITDSVKYIKIFEIKDTSKGLGNIQIQGSLRNTKENVHPIYTLKCIPALNKDSTPPGEPIVDASNNAVYQWIYEADVDNEVTDGFIDINIKIKVDADNKLADVDLSGIFAGESLVSTSNTTGTDILVVNDISETNMSGLVAVYMRLGENTAPNLSIKYSGDKSNFIFTGQPLTTNDYEDKNQWETKASLSGIGIVTVNSSTINAVQEKFGITTTDIGTIVPSNTDESYVVSSTIRNNITYNINGCTGLGIIPNTDLPFVGETFDQSKLDDYINNGITNLTFPYFNFGAVGNYWCLPLVKDETDAENPTYTAQTYGPYMSPFKLDVSGNVFIRGLLQTAAAPEVLSDRNIKQNIETIPNALEMVNKMRGVFYENKKLNNKKCAGVIAQELEEILPEAVSNLQEYKSVSYNDIIGVLIESVKELSREVKELKEKINKNDE